MCRFLARKHHGHAPMSHEDVAAASGLARSTVVAISKLASWDTLSLRTIVAFSEGCGVDLLAPWRQIRFWKRNKLAYLGRANPQQRKMFARLLADLNRQRALVPLVLGSGKVL